MAEAMEVTVHAPRTYQSAWSFDGEGRPEMMTAEEWLEQEALIDKSLDDAEEQPDDGPARWGVMMAIAKEIAELRREKSQWATDYTRLVGQTLAR